MYSYTAFGEIYNQTRTTANSYLYTGQQFDRSTVLYSLRARFYNPFVRRFLSQDTWAVNYSNPIELNRYGYAAGNPINASDPSGLFLVDYALNALSKLEAARGFVALGMATGAIYGYVSASLCGGNVAWGIASGAVIGGVSAIGMTFAPAFVATEGVTASVVSTGMAFNDIAQHGWNACNVMQAFTSILGIAGGVYGGMSGGSGFGPSLAWAGNNGYVYTMASTAQGGIEGTLSVSSLMAIVNNGGEGGGENDDSDNPSKVQRYLKQLPDPGDMIEVQPGEISYQLLADLHKNGRAEFSLVKTGNGRIYLVRGDITVGYPQNTVKIIAHTHPWAKIYPSNGDFAVLNKLKQPSSLTITEYGSVTEFYANPDFIGEGTYKELGHLP